MWLGLLYGVCADPPPRVNEEDAIVKGKGAIVGEADAMNEENAMVKDEDAMVKDEDAMVILFVWEAGRDRPLTVGGPASSAPDMARLLREAGQGAPILMPRCDACGTSFELPLE